MPSGAARIAKIVNVCYCMQPVIQSRFCREAHGARTFLKQREVECTIATRFLINRRLTAFLFSVRAIQVAGELDRGRVGAGYSLPLKMAAITRGLRLP